MSEAHSTPPPAGGKPAKPDKSSPDFPLTAHPAGYWCKKIRGKIHYFGPWSDPEGARKNYEAQAEALHAGRKPREKAPEGTTVKELVNHFLYRKETLMGGGELSPRTWKGYKEACDEVIAAFGKGRLVADLDADDFAKLRDRLARRYGPHRLGTTIQCVRCLFKYAFEVGLVPTPVRYGPEFKRPSKKTLRLHRAARGPKLFTAEEVRKLIGTAVVPLKAMLLLGINAGFGNADCGNLPLSALDLDAGWVNYPRPKTGLDRRAPLWPETVEALRAALAKRPAPKRAEDAGLFFVTSRGLSWGKEIADSPVTKETKKLLVKLGVNGRKGLGFYTLRHVFRTVADEAKDQPAVDFIMGHEVPHMSAVYRETISDARLLAVTDHVHAWLFPPSKDKAEAKDPTTEVAAAPEPGD
jgi:integrase